MDEWGEKLRAVSDQRQFRAQLVALKGPMSYKDVETASGGELPTATSSTTLRLDQLPTLKFVERYLTACGLAEADQALWKEVWQAVTDGRAPLGEPQDAVPPNTDTLVLIEGEDSEATETSDPTPPSWFARRRRLIGLTSLALAGALLVGGLWWHAEQVEADRTAADAKAAAERAAQEWRKSHCDTDNPALHTTPTWCAGVTDGHDRHGVFGKELEPVLAAIDAENQAVMKTNGYVTVALMAPLTKGDKSLTSDRAAHQVEGAFIAQHEANKGQGFPKIRLVLANMGSDESSWPAVVDQLKTMTGGSDRLVAVTGMGLSQQQTIDAARSLSEAHIPMVGDVITADGFDKSGSIDRGAAIPGLVRVAPNVSTQIKALAQEVAKHPEMKAGAVISAPETPDGKPDFYTQSMEAAIRNPDMGLLPYLEAGGLSFNFTVQQGAEDSSLRTIADNMCGTPKIDVVFYAGRATYLETFIEKLRNRPCRTTPITVVTGSDAATVNPEIKGLNDPGAPISVLYVPLADPVQLADGSNPDQTLYLDFATEFTTTHYGQQFDKSHLASGWAVMAHDALLTARLAVRNAAGTSQTPPNVRAVGDQLYLFDGLNAVTGAGGVFRIDPQSGNRKGSHDPKVVRKGTRRP